MDNMGSKETEEDDGGCLMITAYGGGAAHDRHCVIRVIPVPRDHPVPPAIPL